MILVFFGMTASGKSTLAATCATRWQVPHHNTDQVRKELAGLAAGTPRPDGIDQGIYTREMSSRTYAALLERAAADLQGGAILTILDGSYSTRVERERVRELASRLGTPLRFLYCWCSEDEAFRRMRKRAASAFRVSDGRPEIYRHQQKTFTLPEADEKDVLLFNTEEQTDRLAARLESVGFLPAGLVL